MDLALFYNDQPLNTLNHSGDFSRLKIAVPGKSGHLKITFAVPVLDIHGYWIPENRTPSTKIHWVITAESAAQRSFPFISFFNAGQLNRLSVGTTDLIDDTRITAKMNQEKCTYDLTVEIALSALSEDFELIIDQREQIWTGSLADWRSIAGGKLPEFPAGAWEPVYCTWYAVHASVLQDWVEENARIAADLGFKTLIIDDGWCFDAMRRVTPETLVTWYELIGDWEMSKIKFPDFDAHRQRVQAMGMKYLLWMTPFLIGNKSGIYQEIKDTLRPEYVEGCHVFNSNHPDAASKIIAKMRHVIEDYKLDGVKIDFLDSILPNINTPLGADTMQFIREMTRNIREVNPEALIEFRQSYATLQMIPYGTQFRAGDVPFDFIDNFQRLCQIRISMGDNIPIHADPAYWHPQESAENISRHMIASLVGVPMLSMDMTCLSELEHTIIGFWLKFYQEHRNTLNFGKWDIAYHQSGVTYAMSVTPEETVIILHDSARLSEALGKSSGKVWICNLSPDKPVLENAECFTPTGEKTAAGIIPAGGLGVR